MQILPCRLHGRKRRKEMDMRNLEDVCLQRVLTAITMIDVTLVFIVIEILIAVSNMPPYEEEMCSLPVLQQEEVVQQKEVVLPRKLPVSVEFAISDKEQQIANSMRECVEAKYTSSIEGAKYWKDYENLVQEYEDIIGKKERWKLSTVSLRETKAKFDIAHEEYQILLEDDACLIARIMELEVGNIESFCRISQEEAELAQALTMVCIINRVKSDRFPNTVREVIYQPGQYQPVQVGMFHGEAEKNHVERAKELILHGIQGVPETLVYQIHKRYAGWFRLYAIVGNQAFGGYGGK